jgi:hypothetical protein
MMPEVISDARFTPCLDFTKMSIRIISNILNRAYPILFDKLTMVNYYVDLSQCKLTLQEKSPVFAPARAQTDESDQQGSMKQLTKINYVQRFSRICTSA